jgi:hypothetical protein
MANRFWVGGAGNWSSTTKWSATSGGASGASVPTSADAAIFDANSGGKFTATVDTAQSVNSLTITPTSAVGVLQIALTAPLTTGNLTTTGTAGNNRIWFRSNTYGISIDFIVNGTVSISDCDFRGLYVRGTAAPISGTRIGNRGECKGITFSTPKTVYWNLAAGAGWSANAWALSSGGAVNTDNFPLPQDTATIVNTGLNTSATITLDTTIAYCPNVDMSGRTSAMTLSTSNATTVYGNWTNGSGTAFTGTSILTFSGGTTQTITSAGKTFTCPITVNTYGGTVQLADALNIGSNTLTVTNGTFTAAGYAVNASSLSSSNSNVRTINLGASTVTLSTSGSAVNFNATNFTFNAGTSQITFTGAPTMIGGGLTFYNVSVTFTGGSGTNPYIDGQNTFNNLSIVPRATDGIRFFEFFNNQTINGTLTCAGATPTRRVFLYSNTIGTPRTLTVNSISATDCDFRDIILAGAASGASPTRAGNCGGNTGITFPAPKTVYWNLAGAQNWSSTGWATSSGGTPATNNFPLAQDTAVFDNTGVVGTITINTLWNIGTFDASLRTSAMTLTTSTISPLVYGDWKFGTGVTSSSTTGSITFSKNGTQTITSNGVQFGCPIIINHPLANVQLADALSISSIRRITLTAGVFDAVVYNVTTGVFANFNTTNTLKMGSGTWSLSGTGSVWQCNQNPIIFAGTSTIVLTDTSTTSRTFDGGNSTVYYNKLTIGGSTGTSSLSIFGSSITFGELASTKTVAHTIFFQSSNTFTIGKWAVTGTVGNVVSVNSNSSGGSFSLSIAGPASSGIDYLSVRDCAATTSPGEFYVGANSTNVSGNTGVIFTATPAPRTLYWVGGTGNWSSTTKWATSSGGAGGAAIPTSLDAVNFDALSNATAYTATIDASVSPLARCASFTMAGPLTGNVTFAGSVGIAFHGNVSFAATGITRTYSGAMQLAGDSSYTFTTNSLVFTSTLTQNGVGSTWTLGVGGVNLGNARLSINQGSFSTSASNYPITAGGITLDGSTAVRSLFLNGSTVTCLLLGSNTTLAFSVTTNLTFNAGTSTFSLQNATAGINSGGLTFNNVSFTSATASAITITGENTFNTLSFAGRTSVSITPVTFAANQTISTLTLNAGTASAYRTFLRSDTIGTQRTLNVTTLTAGAADIDFRDIAITGAAAPLTGTRFGDAKGNSGITFPAAKTVYWAQASGVNWGSATSSWSLTNGGSADAAAFPLAQDTAFIPFARPNSGQTITVNQNWNIGTIDMNERNGSALLTLATGSNTPAIYGNWINGTGTTLTNTGTLTFAGRSAQTITSAGRTFTQSILLGSLGGTLSLLDAFISSATTFTAINIQAGTFNAGVYNVTMAGGFYVFDPSIGARGVNFGSGTWSMAAGTAPMTIGGSANTPTIAGTATINFTAAFGKVFTGGNLSYTGITINQGGAGELSIDGNNTFKSITNTYSATGATTISFANTTQTLTQPWTATGEAGRILTVSGTSAASPGTLIFSGGGTAANVDYLAINNVRAYNLTNTWYAGDNSTNDGSLGWVYASKVISTAYLGNFFAFF